MIILSEKIDSVLIKQRIMDIIENSDECGFEVYVITKSTPELKKMRFYEENGNNLHKKIKGSIFKTINEKYILSDIEYVSADYIADDQGKFYMIETNEEYDPFSVLNSQEGEFSKSDTSVATGIVYSIRKDNNQVWAYQHLWNMLVPNKTKKNKLARIISSENGDIFEELTDPIITFSDKIDLLIIENCIITSDYKLLQNYFGFQQYIKIRAGKTIKAIEEKGILANVDKLNEYIQRGGGKPKYSKKLMRVFDSRALKMNTETLWKNIHKSKRWNGKIKEENGRFVLDTFSQVEDLIDLLDDRYTRSDITDVEYDTDVKRAVEDVEPQ